MHPFIESGQLRLLVAREAGVELEDEKFSRVEAGVNLLEVDQRAEKEPRTGQENQGESDLRDHKNSTGAQPRCAERGAGFETAKRIRAAGP